METSQVRDRITNQIKHILDNTIIINRRFLDDEQLVHSEQLEVLEEIFNANVRDAEIMEISSHFAPILRNDHPVHLALWGKTGTGKTVTMRYFLTLLADMCNEKKIPIRFEHLDMSTPRTCFRALNDLACLLGACKRYKKGISLEELMLRIETALSDYNGYFILFVDEVDNIRTDKDNFLAFLVRRLPQRIPAKLVLVFASNRINWMDNLDPRIKSFLKLNEILFKPYDAVDLQHILKIRVKKALNPKAVEQGVVEKIAALSSYDHGDARQAVALLSQSAHLAEKAGTKITLELVTKAADEIEREIYVDMIRTAPVQLQAVMAAVIQTFRGIQESKTNTSQVYEVYKLFCREAGMRPLAVRAFRDRLNELDMYTFLRTQILSCGRYGRTREIFLELPEDIIQKIEETIYMNFNLSKPTAGKRRNNAQSS